ncbi:Gfo/Idh/MocA family oxidoreductase [Georgenia halophila]|uniref:Gfo/Idh/MocA family oxidoreductase n=1 Tax=Georgenia halophila TaxID=620889 RepID=A0ABP8LH58_9MICO
MARRDVHSDSEVRVAVVGAMGFGRVHLHALRDITATAALCAVVDPRPLKGEVEELAAGAPRYASLTDLLAQDRPDVVVIASPIPTHAPLAEEAMRAGCHVLLEKPPTATFADYGHLRRLARETGSACQVGFQADGSSAYAEIDAVVASGEIGDVRGVGGVGTWVRDTSYYTRAAWAGRRRVDGVEVVDGVVTNPFAHAVAAALRLAGARRAEDVAVVETDLFHANDIEADDTSSVRIVTSSGLPVAVGLTLCATDNSEPRVIVHGTDGHVVLRYKSDVVDVVSPAGTRRLTCTSTGLLPNLVGHVRDREVPLLSALDDAGGFMRVMEAVRTAPEPAPIGPEHVTWREDDLGRHAVVHDVEDWCHRVAEEMQTFSTLGAPWAPAHDPAAR